MGELIQATPNIIRTVMRKKLHYLRRLEGTEGYEAKAGHTEFVILPEDIDKWYMQTTEGKRSIKTYESPQLAVIAFVAHLNKCSEYEASLYCNRVWQGVLMPVFPKTAIQAEKVKVKQPKDTRPIVGLPVLPLGSKLAVKQQGKIRVNVQWAGDNARERKLSRSVNEALGIEPEYKEGKPKDLMPVKELPKPEERTMKEGESYRRLQFPKLKYIDGNNKPWRSE